MLRFVALGLSLHNRYLLFLTILSQANQQIGLLCLLWQHVDKHWNADVTVLPGKHHILWLPVPSIPYSAVSRFYWSIFA